MKKIEQIWYSNSKLYYFLLPLTALYRLVIALRRLLYRLGYKKTTRFSIPIIVVGNLTVGGTGKTPFVIWLANWLQQQGYQPGIVSRGYGAKKMLRAQVVTETSDPIKAGDEAVLLARKTHCPLVVHPHRAVAVAALLQNFSCNIVISDDGLQHYALARDIEIIMIDGMRYFGNGYCLPAGPLREPPSRGRQADFIIVNQGEITNDQQTSQHLDDSLPRLSLGQASKTFFKMQLQSSYFYAVANPLSQKSSEEFKNQVIHAVAAIGNPARFFKQLQQMNLTFIPHEFPDHYRFKQSDIDFGDDEIVIMTEKDAVKCQSFVDERHWCLPVSTQLEGRFEDALRNKLVTIMKK